MRLRRVAITGVVMLAGCSPVSAEDGASFLRATVQGGVREEYRGTGDFGMDNLPRTFIVSSAGTGAAAGQSLMLMRPQQAEHPAPGRYPLVPPHQVAPGGEAFTAVYSRAVGGGHESFISRAGTVEITRASPMRVEGTFHFQGVLCTARTPERKIGACDPATVPPDAPTVEVSGSFSARPASDVGIPL